MADTYYLRVRGDIKGLIRSEQVIGLIRKKRIGRHHEMSEDRVNWTRVGDMPEWTGCWAPPADTTASPVQVDSRYLAAVEPPCNALTPEDWYFASGSDHIGPVTASQMRTLLHSGAIAEGILVWTFEPDEWVTANSVRKLRGSRQPAKAPPAPPARHRTATNLFCMNCGEGVSPKAIACTHCGVPPRAEKLYCHCCGMAINHNQVMCVECGAGFAVISSPSDQQTTSGNRSKSTAGILALLVGGLGAHKFYHGSWGWGLIYLLSVMTFIPAVVAFIEGLQYLLMDAAAYDKRYNQIAPAAFKW